MGIRIKIVNAYLSNKEIAFFIQRVKNANRIVESFFKYKFNNVEVILAKDYEDYCRLLKDRRPVWGVTSHRLGKIYVLNPFLWDNKTGHTIDDLQSSIIHELVQVYFYRKYRDKIGNVAWMVRGLGVYLGVYSRKLCLMREKSLKKMLRAHGIPNVLLFSENFYSYVTPSLCYIVSYRFHDFLIGLIGKDQYLKFINNLMSTRDINKVYSKFFLKKQDILWKEFIDKLSGYTS